MKRAGSFGIILLGPPEVPGDRDSGDRIRADGDTPPAAAGRSWHMVASEQAAVDRGASPGKPVVLCVDDERPVLAALTRALRREPYELVTTEDPEEALERIRSGAVSVILADYRMRVMGGTSLLQ